MRIRASQSPVLLLASGAVLLAPSLAAACAVCMTGKEDDTRIAFELMTGFMTVIPFVLVGGVFWWLRGRLREVESRHERAREENASSAPRAAEKALRAVSVTPTDS